MKNIQRKNTPTPTSETYTGLEKAYDHFNVVLFNSTLPDCLLTLQRKRRTHGYFSPKRFINATSGAMIDEIALNPDCFGQYPLMEAFQTLVHEMVHLWQHHFGDPGRGRYHNKQWAQKMISIGLMPSSTGKPGGKTTGDHMADYPAPEGIFIQEANKLIAEGYKLPWIDKHGLIKAFHSGEISEGSLAEGLLSMNEASSITQALDTTNIQTTKPGRIKYVHVCNGELLNLWGKAKLNIACGDCGEFYEVSV